MDPIMQMLQQMMGSMQDTTALQPGFDASPMGAPGGAPGAAPGGDIAQLMQGIKAPQAQKPVFSGGVSGMIQPYVQQMPNMLTPALAGASQRIAGGGAQMPSLGQILAGR